MASHTPWRSPPLQEAVFEVRFPAVEDYSIFVGGMAEVKRNLATFLSAISTVKSL